MKILVDSFPACPRCGIRVTSARHWTEGGVEILGFQVTQGSLAVLVRPCLHTLTGDIAVAWMAAALRRTR